MSTPTMGTKQTIADDALVELSLQGGGAHGAFTWGVISHNGRLGRQLASFV